jgi:hypothetical protein
MKNHFSPSLPEMSHSMRTILIIFLLLASTANALSWSDGAGDVDSNIPNTESISNTDLLGAAIEIRENISFEIQYVPDSPIPVPSGLYTDYWVEFSALDEQFSFVLRGAESTVGSQVIGEGDAEWHLYRGESNTLISSGIATIDSVAGKVSATTPISVIQSAAGTSLGPGSLIEVTAISSHWDDLPSSYQEDNANSNVYARDQIDVPPGAELLVPGAQNGSLGVLANNPTRFTNGEATTFHWPLFLSNKDSTPIEILINVEGPSAYEFHAPKAIQLPANGEQRIDVFASVPFNHEHGRTDTIEVQFDTGTEVITQELFIQYLAVPQPAGHHDEVFTHMDGQSMWLSTLEEDDTSTGVETGGSIGTCSDGSKNWNGVRWSAPLRPSLLIGMRSNGGDALFEGEISWETPIPQGSLYGFLEVYGSSSGTPAFFPVGEADFELFLGVSPAGSLTLSESFLIPEEFLELAPLPGQNIAFSLVYCPDVVSEEGFVASTPANQFGFLQYGKLSLPLEEYHDSIPIDLPGQETTFTGETTARGPPGGWIQFTLELIGSGNYGVSVIGSHASLVSLSQEVVKVEGSSDLTAWIQVPVDALDGDALDVILVATNQENSLDQAVVRLDVVIDSRVESAGLPEVTESKETPSVGVFPGLIILVLLGKIGKREPK